jgi:Tfp pilus assembly protein PilF
MMQIKLFAPTMTRASTEDLCSALEHLERGDWRAAHEIVQRDEDDALACWAHGIVHLMEGDASNARYWYRRAGRAFPAPADVSTELKALRAALRSAP